MDVAVVGAGYTGLAAARHLARAGAKVVVLEQAKIGHGASSRNAGQILTGLKLDAGGLIAQYGRTRARRLFDASAKAIDALEDLIRAEQIACDYERTGHVQAASKPGHFEAFKSEQELLAREFDHPVRLVERSAQHAELGTDCYHGLMVDERSAGLNPAKYVAGLAESAERAGVEFREQTAVVSINRLPGGFELTTGHGALQADNVVVATNGYTERLVPWLARRVVPIGSFVVVTRPLEAEQATRILPRRRMAFDSKHLLHYFRLTADNRLLFGGRAQFAPSTSQTTIESANILRDAMKKIFPDARGLDVEYAWSGNVAFTRDQCPHLGCDNGMAYAVGYCGHGVAMATYCGASAAELLLRGRTDNPFAELTFSPFPLYDGRPWFLPLAAMWYKALDVLT